MHPSTALATVLVDEWIRCGVRHVVLCPGSRSAPLAYAVEAAERAGRVRLHVRVDERSAGFLALGLAKVSRCPAVVVTTSGTAVANLHPALLEASHAQVPLVVMSADRPAELRGTGANQTTVQPGIFSGALRFEHDQPPARGSTGEQASWRSTVCRAWAAAVGTVGDAGPVHLNVAFREPLAPGVPNGDADPAWPEPLDGRLDGGPWVRVPEPPLARPLPRAHGRREPSVAERAPGASSPGTRTLMVLGDLPEVDMAATALEVAAAHGWPVLAEPFGARAATPAAASTLLPHGPLVLLDDELVGSAPPQRVLTVGRNTLHREVSALTRRPDVVVEQVTASARWSDPSHQAARVYRWADFVQSAHEPADPAWTHRWLEAGEDLTRRLAALATEEMCGVNVAATVLQAVTGSDTVVLGSSNVPRDVSLADTGGQAGRTVVGNRGLAGIDGTVSTAVGVALASSGRVLALMGDLTFQHDANGMLIGPWEPQPDVTVVVCNDDGGGIFATLEYGAPEHSAVFRRLFATPTQTSIGMLCAAHGVPHVAVGSLDELRAVLRAPSTGLRVVEVPVDPVVDRRERSAWRLGASRPH